MRARVARAFGVLTSLAVGCGGAPPRSAAWLEDVLEPPTFAQAADACAERWLDEAPQFAETLRAELHPAAGVEQVVIASYADMGMVVHVLSAACDAQLARVVLRDEPRDVIGPTIETDASFARAPAEARARAHATDLAPSGREYQVGLVPLASSRNALIVLVLGAFGSGVVGYEASVVTCDASSCRARTVGQHEHARGPGARCGVVRRVVRREEHDGGMREIVLLRVERDGEELLLSREHDDVDECAR